MVIMVKTIVNVLTGSMNLRIVINMALFVYSKLSDQ